MDIVVNDMVCRLCLKTPLTEFALIDKTAKEILDVLLVKMDLDSSIKPLMCKDCTEIVKKSLSFKSLCVDTEEMLVDEDLLKAEDINANVCRFCIKTVREGHFISLNVFLERGTFSDMIKEYMFHMDLNIIKNPLICLNCRDNMESYFKFLQNCRDTEEKINTYQRNNGVNRQSIMLVNVSETHSKQARKELCNSLKEVKGDFDTEIEVIIDRLPYRNEEINDHEPCICDTKDTSRCFRCHAMSKETATTEDVKTKTVTSEVDNRQLKIETEELIIKDEVTLNETSQQKQLDGKVESQLFECEECEFKTKYYSSLRTHLFLHTRNHSNIKFHKCNICGSKHRYRSSLRKHMLVHKHFSEVQVYHCDMCKFFTKHKGSLKGHMLVHKDSSELQMYQCDSCQFKTKYKTSLKIHVMSHKDYSEIQMYQCYHCKFETKLKQDLRKHMLSHRDSNVRTYKCYTCEFTTKYKESLINHFLTHKNSSEVQMYQCDKCKFETKRKDTLRKHMLVHKDSSQVQMYQCDSCEYQTKHKGGINLHMLVHKKASEVQMYQCDNCEYQAKRKGTLRIHMLVHKDSSKVQMYKCDSCEYQTKRKGNLKNHMLVHKD